MKLRKATLIKGTNRPLCIGRTGPERALVKLDGQSTAAIIKNVDTPSITAECFAALVLSSWGIPVAEPLLVEDEGQLLFGSLELEYPNLKQRMGWQADLSKHQQQAIQYAACKIVASFPETPAALAADEVIANYDRNMENILWDGGSPTFIDHERAFGRHSPDANKLAQMVIIAGEHLRVERSAVSHALTLATTALHDAAETLSENYIDARLFKDYVEARIPHLGNRIIDRFPKPKDLLSSS